MVKKQIWNDATFACLAFILTLAELHVSVLSSFIKLIKHLQNLMKLLPNHIMLW